MLYRLWKKPSRVQLIRCGSAITSSCAGTAITTLLYFLLGYHVHEKAILPTIILAGLLIPTSVQDAKIFVLLTVSGTLGLFPLLFTPRDVITETLLSLSYVAVAWYSLNKQYHGELQRRMTVVDYLVLGLMCVSWCCAYLFFPCLLPLLQLSGITRRNYPFMPLMIISVSCAIGNCYVLCLMCFQLFKEKSE